jgi:hypothetical protein
MLKQLVGIAATHYNEKVNTDKELELSEHIGKWLGTVVYHLGGWAAFANATVGQGQKKSAVDEARQRIKQGIIIGFCLKHALGTGGGISTGARELHSDKAQASLKKKGVALPLQTQHHIVNKLWPRYKDAAHLWTAFFDNRNKIPQNPHHLLSLDQFDVGVEAKGLLGFIKLADLYREAGASLIPKPGPKKPILNKDTAWKIKI